MWAREGFWVTLIFWRVFDFEKKCNFFLVFFVLKGFKNTKNLNFRYHCFYLGFFKLQIKGIGQQIFLTFLKVYLLQSNITMGTGIFFVKWGLGFFMSFIAGNGIFFNATGNGKKIFKIETGISRYFV